MAPLVVPPPHPLEACSGGGLRGSAVTQGEAAAKRTPRNARSYDDSVHLVGSYTPPIGRGAGISILASDGAALFVSLDSPSFIAPHPRLPLVYAVLEVRGELIVLDARTGATVQDGIVAGSGACHVRIAEDGGSLVVACWGDGSVVHYVVESDGYVSGRATLPPLDGVSPLVRSRAHSSVAFGDGFVTTDIGADMLRVWSGSPPVEVQRLVLPRGCGPRHMVAHTDGSLYVCTENSNEIVHVVCSDGELAVAGISPVRVGGMVAGDAAAEIALHPAGWLTVGVRGSDVITSSRILPGGVTAPMDEAPTGGATPRHHLNEEDAVLIANEGSSTVTRVSFDPASGALGDVVSRVDVGSPAFLLQI